MKKQPPACTMEGFLRDVKNHRITIIKDDGVYRHIKFAQPGTFNRWFELITWPGVLVIHGDSGTFCFSRSNDMFGFFRQDARPDDKPGTLYISESYWAEKCVARNRGGVKQFSPDAFREAVRYAMLEQKISKNDRQKIKDDVLSQADNGESFAMTAAINFRGDDGFRFADFWEHDCSEYTHYFLWCCYAIAWGIQQYDAATWRNHRVGGKK